MQVVIVQVLYVIVVIGKIFAYIHVHLTTCQMNNNYRKEMQRIAFKIRKVREYKNYSQEYLASKIGISQNAYSKIELGYSKITLDRLFHIANLLDVDTQELMTLKA